MNGLLITLTDMVINKQITKSQAKEIAENVAKKLKEQFEY